MKIHILYEHVEREIYCAFLIKFELEKRGHDVEIFRIQEPHLPFINSPDLIIMPWFSVNSQIEDLKIGYIKRIKKILNLQYEQVMSQMWVDDGFHIPSGLTKNGYHICWGDNRKQLLLNNNIPKENLRIIGDIRQDFSKKGFESFFKSKNELSKEFNIPLNHEWNLFISSFSFANPSEKYMQDTSLIIGKSNAEKWHTISKSSQKEILNWIEQFIIDHPNQEFIYRPHPSEIEANNYSKIFEISDKFPNFHFIFKYSVQDWILNSDYINTWISTSIIECYKLNKQCNILRPIIIDEYYDMPFYINAEHIHDYKLFEERNTSINNRFPIKDSEIRKYYKYAGSDEFIYKKICDYIEEIITNDSPKEYYIYNPFIDNLKYTLKKLINMRIPSIILNVFKNKKNNQLKHIIEYDSDKISKIKQIVDENFD